MARGDVHHDPTVPRVVAMNFALLDQALIGKKFHDASKEPNYGLMYPTREEEAVDKGLRDRTQKYYKRNRSMDDVKLKALNCIRAAEGTAVTAGTVMEGKRLIDLADGITAVPSLGSDDVAAYGFFRSTGELVESTEELLQELRAALGRTAPAGAETAGAAADGDDDDDDEGDGAGTNAGTGTGTGTGDDANAAGGGIGGFATPPANAVNAGSERQRGGTRSSGSSSSGARSVLSGIGSSIRNRRNRGRRNGKGAVRNLRELLRSPISASASRDGGHDHEGDDEDGDGGWEVDVESPAGRDPPPDDDATVEGGVPTDDGRTSTRGGLHGSPSYDGDNDDSDDGDDDDDDDDDLEVEFTIGIVSDDRRGRPRDGNHSLGTGTVHGTSRPTSPEESRVGRDPPSVGISEEGGGEDPPTLDDLVGPGASADLGMGNGSRSPVALTLPSAAENAGGGGAGNVANANIQDDEDAAPNVGATDAGIGVGVEETKEEEFDDDVELGDGMEGLVLGDDDDDDEAIAANNNNAIANAFGAGGVNGIGNNGGIGATGAGAGFVVEGQSGGENPPEIVLEIGVPPSPGNAEGEGVADLEARVNVLETELAKEKKEKKKLEKKLEKLDKRIGDVEVEAIESAKTMEGVSNRTMGVERWKKAEQQKWCSIL